ncbi:mitotic-spindle organizing protein 2B isoform X3 [Microcaecilia unicolor]|nr:mitotic-spindle organizing protein 2B-like isoform X3 [Microcaecilia unicolor]XP_030075041.1 mitotic-spindle organizing protein 2B-like isoform X3 [Microcaecilia unicolor]XP_030075042.1 mitotic-spindle organizing protein 2B-like isoform X3 [Microcaecilia unicolor]XP_030075043.1 mitotic-spindle organizing protein 2B-like isoform X3 [Microcaecilia unicolor]XP_030075044.1 mitotic-spindle organizing protein 2B-like isoform X3 [Microcaecilia unicolor]XP_030075229.1 mitotic-spindle organizing pro
MAGPQQHQQQALGLGAGSGMTLTVPAVGGGGGSGPGPEQAALVAAVSGSLHKYALKKKKVLNAEEAELYELAQAAGISMDQEVFKILVDLLKMNVAPLAVFQMLKSMCAGHRLADTASETSTAAPPVTLSDAREVSFVSTKDSKIPAPLSFSSSALRPPRLKASKIVVCSSADVCSPLSQGPPGSFQFSCCLFSPFAGRNKPSAAVSGTQIPAERNSSREGSSQRMPRQTSATRLQKGGSSGKAAGGGGS